MAKIVPDEDAWGPKTPRGKVMDWMRYCDGRSWRLERGVDVDPEKSMHSKRSSFRQWAARQGLDMSHVHTSVVDDQALLIKVDHEAWPDKKGRPLIVSALVEERDRMSGIRHRDV